MRVLCRRSTRLRLAVHSFPPAPDISFLSLFRTLPQCPDPCPAFRRLSVKPIQKGFKSSDDKFRYSAAAFQNITDIDDINEVLDRDEYERYKDQRMGGLFQSKASDGAIAKSKRYEPTWYTTVEIQRIGDKHYGVTLDGVPVQARQSDDRHRLVVPSEAWAALVALEFEEALRSNGGYDLVTPHQMPMYDLASAAQQTGRMNVHERVDQLTAALETDTLLLRDAATDKRYGVQLDTVQMWFDRVMNVTTPRDLLSAADGETSYTMVGDDVLIAFKAWVQRNVSNKYSLVGLHALQGYFASPILSTAACTGVLAPDVMMKLGNADELTSVERNGFVRGYHDVRFNEMYTKCYAAILAYRISQGIESDDCEIPYKHLISHRTLTLEEQLEAQKRIRKENARSLLKAQHEEIEAEKLAEEAAAIAADPWRTVKSQHHRRD